MEERNQEVLASAYRRAVAKSLKIKELMITPKMSEEDVDALIEIMAKRKSEQSGKDWTTHVQGQRWYIEDLVKFSALDASSKLEIEYKAAFPDIASEEEMLNALEQLS